MIHERKIHTIILSKKTLQNAVDCIITGWQKPYMVKNLKNWIFFTEIGTMKWFLIDKLWNTQTERQIMKFIKNNFENEVKQASIWGLNAYGVAILRRSFSRFLRTYLHSRTLNVINTCRFTCWVMCSRLFVSLSWSFLL